MLFTLSHSPTQCDLSTLLQLVSDSDALLLLQDGVLSGLTSSDYLELLLSATISLYALKDDLDARGVMNCFSKKINIIEYDCFVDLTEQHQCQIAW